MELKTDPALNEFMQKLKQPPKPEKKTTTDSPPKKKQRNHYTQACTGFDPKLARLANRDKVGKKG
jgi:hypothetical protein